MAIRFYGDESEDQGSKVMAIAGFIGMAEEWDDLQEKWIARVKPTGVSAYHMTDCECGLGEFSEKNGWSPKDRQQLTTDLIDLIIQHKIFLIGEGLLLDDYKEIPPVTESGDRLGRDKWHMAFQGVLHEAAMSLGDECPPEETIAFFFDWKDKQGSARFFFDYMKTEEKLSSWHHRLGTLTFGHKEFDVAGSIPLLQVADIAAVETRKRIGNPITHPHIPVRKSFLRLKEAHRIWQISYMDKQVLDSMHQSKVKELGLTKKSTGV